MKAIPHYFSFLVVATFFLGCATPELDSRLIQLPAYPEGNERAIENVRFVQIAEYGLESEDEESIIGGFPMVTIGPDGTVFILDDNPGRLKAYAPEGTFLWSKLTAGQGPGEIYQARSMETDGSHFIYILNQGGTRIDQITMRGDHVRSISMEDLGLSRPIFSGLLSDSTFVFSKGIPGSFSSKITIVLGGEEWNVKNVFTIDFSDVREIDSRMYSWLDLDIVDGQIIAPDLDEFRYKVFDEFGMVQKEVSRNLDVLVGPQIIEMGSGYGVRNTSSLSPPFRLNDKWRIGQASWITNSEELEAFRSNSEAVVQPEVSRESTLDFYDNSWKLIYTLDAENQAKLFEGWLLTSDGRGHVYIYSRSTGLVVKYRVEINH